MKKFSKLLCFMVVFIVIIVVFSSVSFAADSNSIKINNTTLSFNKMVFIDAKYGDDVTGDGSESNPFMGIRKAMDFLCDNNYKNNVGIVMNDGDYDWTPVVSESDIDNKFNQMKISFIAKRMGKAFIHSDKGLNLGLTISNPSSRIKLTFYGIIFQSTSIGMSLSMDDWINEYYNCVFDNLAIGGWNNVVVNASAKVENSIYVNCVKGPSKCPLILGNTINCASTNSYYDPNITVATCLTNVIFDSDYKITSSGWKGTGTGTNFDGSKANIGVYGGNFAWNDIQSPTNFSAKVEEKKVLLKWESVNGAIGYIVKRSEIPGGPYTTTFSAISTEYSDDSAVNGTTYYYVVAAVNDRGESPNSNEASATLTAPQPTNQLKLVLEVNEEKQLSISDKLSDNTETDWTSSNLSIAAIDVNGRVKALKPGNTVITCIRKDKSYTESINVLVVDLEYQLAVDLNIGGTCRLTIDDLANTTYVTWSSYDSSIATVSANGKVIAVNDGLTYIVANDKNGNEIGRIYIRVRQ